ncbi:hypothetical protein V1264_010557 [Littorina saxatilis]|uniref:THD domain-containing protein n=2 Tax=Littorina saxatilis TaxID=31220 RepID=A0AAN9AQ15_9CAEN
MSGVRGGTYENPSETNNGLIHGSNPIATTHYTRIDSVSSASDSTLAGRNPSASQSLIHIQGAGDQPGGSSPMPTDALERVESTNRRMRCTFFICIFVLIVYAATIAWFIAKNELQPSSSASSSSLSSEPKQDNCVTDGELDQFKRLWDPEDGNTFLDVLMNSGDFTKKGHQICFHSLKWVPLIMGKINVAVDESVKYIERQQEKLNETVRVYTSLNATKHDCNKDAVSSPIDATDPSKSVYAHFFCDTNDDDTSDDYSSGMKSLKWLRESTKQSSKRGMDVNIRTGEFTIRHSGFYFLYSHVTFKPDQNIEHHVVKRSHESTTLLKSHSGPASFLQGVFMLKQNDSISVRATTKELYRGDDRSTYFGAYLIRT